MLGKLPRTHTKSTQALRKPLQQRPQLYVCEGLRHVILLRLSEAVIAIPATKSALFNATNPDLANMSPTSLLLLK